MTNSPYTGFRFPFQAQVGGMRGGMMSEPYSGIISGLITTLAGVNADKVVVNVTKGSARLDGQLCTLATDVSNVVVFEQTGAFSTAGKTYVVPVYLKPRRKVPTTTSTPSGNAPDGTQRIKVQSLNHPLLGDYEEFVALYVCKSNSWSEVSDVLNQPPSAGQNNSPFNDVLEGIDSTSGAGTGANAAVSASFSSVPEKPVYFPVPVVHTPNQGINFLRRSASVLIALVTVTGGSTPTATVTTYTEFEKVPM
jgi:hypothetical protein